MLDTENQAEDLERKIIKAGLRDATINFWLRMQQLHGLTWTKTLEYMVTSLLAAKQDVYQRELERAMRSVEHPLTGRIISELQGLPR